MAVLLLIRLPHVRRTLRCGGTLQDKGGRKTFTFWAGVAMLKAHQLSAGAFHNCTVSTAAGTNCWGDDSYGYLSDGTTAQRTTPFNVPP